MTSQVLLFSQPRSGSHLLERMLGKQSNVNLLEHPFSSSRGDQVGWLRRESYAEGMSASELFGFEDGIHEGVDEWQGALANAHNATTILMVHTHAFFPVSPNRMLEYMEIVTSQRSGSAWSENFTMLPDGLLLHPGTVPIFTIRNPRLAVPSAYRTLQKMDLPHGGGRANFIVTTCNIWNRMLYDFYVSHGVEAVIVDGDDYMTSEDFVRHLCTKAGLDPAQAYLAWSASTPEEKEKIHPNYYASQSTLINSSGLIPGRAAKNVDMAEEERKWRSEFGEDLSLVKEMVELAMPDYEYLFDRRLKV